MVCGLRCGEVLLVAANNGGEAGIVLDVIGGQWNSFDIDLAAFEPATSGEIFQLKLDSQSGAIGTKTPLTDFYMDNLYFGDGLQLLELLQTSAFQYQLHAGF